MLRVYRKFLESPSRATYLAVQARLLQRPGFPPQISALLALSDRIQCGAHRQAAATALKLTSRWLLSPRLHYFRALTAQALGEAGQAALARFEMAACLDGLLATGDGTPSHPFIVTYVSDVLDLLHCHRQAALRRHAVIRDNALMDVVTCEDGQKRYFRHPPWTGLRQSIRSVHRTLAPLRAWPPVPTSDLGGQGPSPRPRRHADPPLTKP